MITFGFIFVVCSLLADRSVGEKTLNCQMSDRNECIIHSQSIGASEEATFTVDSLKNRLIKNILVESSTFPAIPAEIFASFRSLEILNVAGQHVEQIRPNTFLNASNLTILDLDWNTVTKLEHDCFEGANNLKEIRLNFNSIMFIDRAAFKNLHKLEILHLNMNFLEHIDKDTFRALASLRTIYLGKNHLEFIHKDLFINNNNLETIYLKQNKLKSVHSQMFNHLSKLDFLWLNENICIDKFYESSRTQIAIVQRDLKMCSENYANAIETIAEVNDHTKFENLVKDVEDMRTDIRMIEDQLKRMKVKLELMEEQVDYFKKQHPNNISNYIT